MPSPLLILGDAPDAQSGLARIVRDLATMLARQPEWRVGTLGWLGAGSCKLPWQQYHLSAHEFGEASFAHVWDDFSSGQKGVVLTVWDLTRIGWLSRPTLFPSPVTEAVQKLRMDSRFRLWGYVPVDADGPRGQLTLTSKEVLRGLDRILAYCPWGESVIRKTIGDGESSLRDLTWLPHGLNGNIFNDKGRRAQAPPTIGVVMSNQPRKDWALAASIAALLRESRPGVRWWWHVDRRESVGKWNLDALLADYDIEDIVTITDQHIADADMAARYRACALTLALGPEGFGYPVFESFACGTPCLHGDYAGGASIMDTCGLNEYLVTPHSYRIDPVGNSERPVYSPMAWVERIEWLITPEEVPFEGLSKKVEHLSWDKLRYPWLKWLRDGLGEEPK